MAASKYVHVVVIYPVLRNDFQLTPDSGYPPGGTHQRNLLGADLVSDAGTPVYVDDVTVIHLPKGGNDYWKKDAVILSEHAKSVWDQEQFVALARRLNAFMLVAKMDDDDEI